MNATDLKTLRQEAGLTLGQLSDAIGVHPRTIRRWEKGTHRIPLALQERLECAMIAHGCRNLVKEQT